MKQAFPVLKVPILVLLLIAGTTALSAQNCYKNFLEEGKKAFDDFQFETAIKKFEAAKVCPDRPTSSEVEDWLAKAQNGYIDRLQLIASRYLTSEGQRAFQQKDYRLAFRLYQEALIYKSDNEQAIQLQDQLLTYLADYQYKKNIDPRFYDPSQVALKGGEMIVVFSENEENGNTLIKLIEAESASEKQTFEVKGSLSNYQFSEDGKWLVVEYFDAKNQMTKLSLWDVESGKVIQNFNNIYRTDPFRTFGFSENGQKLVYRSQEIIEKIIYRSDGENDMVEDTLKEQAYALNVFDIPSQKTIFKTKACLDYYSEDADSGNNPFRGQPFRQDLINEKISMKFSTEGVITTNNKNFILKADEFRIRESSDFVISPDGKKFAFHSFGEEEQTTINFNTEIKITFGPRPVTLIGNTKVVDLEADSMIIFNKSDYKELPQRFLPFAFSQDSNHFIFIDSRKWTFTDFNSESSSFEVTDVIFKTSFNIYNLEEKEFVVNSDEKFYDFFTTKDNRVLAWTGSNFLKNENGQFHIYDLALDTLVFEENIVNEFSHFYDVKTENDLIYFSTFDPNTSRTSINIFDPELKKISVLKNDFTDFNYTYVQASPSLKKVAFLKDSGRTISIWDLTSKKQVREINCQSKVAEFDFSEDGNYLIARDKEGYVKVVNLKMVEDLYDYYDNFLEPFTKKDRKEVGLDW